jgi:hypothetical protein
MRLNMQRSKFNNRRYFESIRSIRQKTMTTTTLHVTYTAVPAVIIIRKDGGQTRITPVPLSLALITQLLSGWLSGLIFRYTTQARTILNRLKPTQTKPARPRDISWLIAPVYRVILGHVLAGTTWRQSLAWAVLSS